MAGALVKSVWHLNACAATVVDRLLGRGRLRAQRASWEVGDMQSSYPREDIRRKRLFVHLWISVRIAWAYLRGGWSAVAMLMAAHYEALSGDVSDPAGDLGNGREVPREAEERWRVHPED